MTVARAGMVDFEGQDYAKSLRDLLWDLLFKTVMRRAPDIAEFLASPRDIESLQDSQISDFLQAANIRF